MRNVNGYFRNKIALITGGSSGTGLALARQLAAHGSWVWLMSADAVAMEILLGIQRNRYIILTNSETKLLYHLGGLLGNAV